MSAAAIPARGSTACPPLCRRWDGSSNEDLKQDADALIENLEDLREPVEEFDIFDQCMYTIGLSQLGGRDSDTGFVYRNKRRSVRPALVMDIDGFDRARFDFMVFPGEEPPQIECNEDASGAGTDE